MTLKTALPALLLCLAAGTAQADTVSTLRDKLSTLNAKSAVTATIERKIDIQMTDKPHEQATLNFSASAGPNGIQISLPAELLARAEADRQEGNMDKPHATLHAIDGLHPSELMSTFDGAADLLRELNGATLKKGSDTTLNGAAVKLLELDLVVHLATADQKHAKSTSRTLKLWLGADGLPIQMDMQQQLKGSMMLISFELNESITRSYARKGDRLLTTKEQHKLGSSGMGSTASDERSSSFSYN